MNKITPFLFILLAGFTLTACSPRDSEQAGPTADIRIVAGESIELTPPDSLPDGAACTWTISQAARAEDKDRELSTECTGTIPGSFTVERVGPWEVTLNAETTDSESFTHTVTIRVSPNTISNLVLGYIVIFAIGALFIVSLAWRTHRLRREAAALHAMTDEE